MSLIFPVNDVSEIDNGLNCFISFRFATVSTEISNINECTNDNGFQSRVSDMWMKKWKDATWNTTIKLLLSSSSLFVLQNIPIKEIFNGKLLFSTELPSGKLEVKNL